MAEEELKTHRVSDQLGVYCPEPIFRTRQALEEMAPGEILEVVADDPATAEDIPRLVKRTGDELIKFYIEGGINHFLIRKRGG